MSCNVTTLRLILGDQLNSSHSWFKERRTDTLYCLMEVAEEATYVKHHIQKILCFFGAMRRFAAALRAAGHSVHYIQLDSPSNLGSLTANIESLISQFHCARFEYQEPDEVRVNRALKELALKLSVPVSMVESEHFYSRRTELVDLFGIKKSYLMESFYREMRKKHQVLLEKGKPLGGKWNFDQENRKPLPRSFAAPTRLRFAHDLSEVYLLVKTMGIPVMGTCDPGDVKWPLDRSESLAALEHFAKDCLPHFGTYQDAMNTKHPFIYHSLLSFALNVKMISPREVVERCIDEWRARPEEISLPQIEGFVRQILGWREYMRGIYWSFMPEYQRRNFFNASHRLPDYFWDAETKMNCMRHALKQSLDEAYAHHIQRLMVIGNFCMIAGIDPAQVDEWYLGVYIDAIEWVEITNTRGMSQYADGGLIATKPYAATANYINKMSDYCSSCSYDKSERIGENACPFNSLYWDFFDRNRKMLVGNPRIGMAYRNLDKMSSGELMSIRSRAAKLKANLADL